ncbi:MAG: S9 family peptidase [Vicinamibacterales bacterium]
MPDDAACHAVVAIIALAAMADARRPRGGSTLRSPMNTTTRQALTVSGLLSVAVCVAAQVAPVTPGWTIAETMKVRNVDQVRISPDGRRVLFAVTTAVMTADRSEYVSQIHVANVDGSEERPITPDTSSATSPRWSPDGRWIAFLAKRSTVSQVWLLRADGGEAHALTTGNADVASFQWSPSARQIAFLRQDGPSAAEERAQRAKDDAMVVDRGLKNTRVWLVSVGTNGSATTSERPLTPPDTHVTDGIDWSPDGSTLAIVRTRTADWRDWPSSDIAIVHATSGVVAAVVQGPAADITPLFSPNGRQLAYVASRDPWGRILDVWVLDVASGKSRKLAGTLDGQPALIGWSPNEDRLYFSEGRGTATRLSALPLSGGPPQDIDPGGAVLEGFALSPARTQVAFTRQTIAEPPEAYISSLDRFAPRQVSRANASLPAHPIPRTEAIQWQSTDGGEIEGLLTYPFMYEPGKRYPLALVVHAGGEAFRNTFLANPGIHPVTEFSLRGYVVLRSNARGGALPGYGAASAEPWFRPKDKQYADLMTGVDHVIQMGVADSTRMGIMGWSNGGLATSWVITQTSRFKAAVIGAAFPNLMSQSAANPAVASDLGAEPWMNLAPYIEHSPIVYSKSVSTATLILHGERDDAVPIGQSYEFYEALKRQRVPVEMVVYPRGAHAPQEPRQVADIARRHLEWMDRYLRKDGQAPR